MILTLETQYQGMMFSGNGNLGSLETKRKDAALKMQKMGWMETFHEEDLRI